MTLTCICPGKEVPFYCPKHGRIENPNWPLLFATDEQINHPAEIARLKSALKPEPAKNDDITFATGEWLSEMGDIVYPGDYGC